MTEVLPAIIPESYEDLSCKMSVVKGIVKLVQVDICDGKFVPSVSWPYIGDSDGHFEKITTEEQEGFPFWENMDYEADLMIKATQKSVEKWVEAGAKAIVLHIESANNILDIVKEFRKTYGYAGDSVANVEIGIALNIDTPNEFLYEFLEKNLEGRRLADFIQFMGIKKIGYQGQEFDDEVIKKIKALRKKYPDVTISVDGGVNFDNYKDLVKAGANKLISGSAIYDSENIKEAVEGMKNV
jgi:ribulose-phosphate 3-epimerase